MNERQAEPESRSRCRLAPFGLKGAQDMATTLNPYIQLNGNCAEAVQFWAGALGASA